MASAYQEQRRDLESRVSHDLNGPPGEHTHVLSLTVLFTTVSDTLDALREAVRLAHQLGARIHILAAWVVPYPLPIDRPRVNPEFRLRQFRTVCEQEAIETCIDIRLCRDIRQCLRDALGPHSLILLGGGGGWWPFKFEKRLAKELIGDGHQIVLVGNRQRAWS